MPFIIDGKKYASIDDAGQKGLTMREQLLIETEFQQPLETLFEGLNLSEKALKSLPAKKRDAIALNQRRSIFISVWISRLRAGEDLSFDEAIDIELDKFQVVDDADPLDESTPPTSE